MKRVLQFIETTGPGGAETIFLSLLAGLNEKDWEVVPLVTGTGWLKTRIEELGFLPSELPTGGSFDFRLLSGIKALIRKESIDLVHTHLQGATVYGTLAAALAGIPVVATFHGFPDLDFGGATGWLKTGLLRRSGTHFAFVSDALRRDALEVGLVPPQRAEVIGNGIDTAVFGPSLDRDDGHEAPDGSPRPGPFLVGAVGNVRPAKDYGNLIRAAARLQMEAPGRFRFLIYGQKTDPLYSELIALRGEFGLTEAQVSFEGFCDDVPGAMAGLDCLAIASNSEGFSLAAIQAMSSGVPVVATRCGGPEEIIDDQVDGLLVPAADPEGLAAGLRLVSESLGLRGALVGAARRKVEERFSLAAMISKYERVYRKVLQAEGT